MYVYIYIYILPKPSICKMVITHVIMKNVASDSSSTCLCGNSGTWANDACDLY